MDSGDTIRGLLSVHSQQEEQRTSRSDDVGDELSQCDAMSVGNHEYLGLKVLGRPQ